MRRSTASSRRKNKGGPVPVPPFQTAGSESDAALLLVSRPRLFLVPFQMTPLVLFPAPAPAEFVAAQFFLLPFRLAVERKETLQQLHIESA